MALFTHLTPEKNARSIRRSGITGRRVFSVPSMLPYDVSHQWVRELRRWSGQRTYVAVDFRLADSETVSFGHYGRPQQEMTAAEAIAAFRALDDARGYEVRLHRAVARDEIRRVRHVRQGVGWRYEPNAHGRRPCGCPGCLPAGAFKAADFRARFGDPPLPKKKRELMAQLAAAEDEFDLCFVLQRLGSRSRGGAAELAYLLHHPDPEVREALAETLTSYRDGAELLRRPADDPDEDVRAASRAHRR